MNENENYHPDGKSIRFRYRYRNKINNYVIFKLFQS